MEASSVAHDVDAVHRNVKAVIFDLDGTILDTETLCFQVGKEVVRSYGKELTIEVARLGVGKRPLECWSAICEALDLQVDAQTLVDQTEPLLQHRWGSVNLLPGAERLIKHLHAAGVLLAIATSTCRRSFERKTSKYNDLLSLFKVVVCGDEVENGKPAPDSYIQAAEELGVDAKDCLVIEDAPSGIQAAKAAGACVVGIPSLVDKSAYSSCGCDFLASLLDFDPAQYGLPAFTDLVHGTVPLDKVWRLKGPVVKGFGRGSKELGIRTANLSEDAISAIISEAVTGIYYGWASIGCRPRSYPMVMSVGYNPFFKNEHKTCEPWILAEFDQDFYGQELRLLVCGYIRPEADFTTLENLIARIHMDADVTKEALQNSELAAFSQDSFLLATP